MNNTMVPLSFFFFFWTSDLIGIWAVPDSPFQVLGIFFALVFFRKLAWAFTAETLSILGVTAGVGLIGAFTTTYRTWMAFVVFAMYPASLVFVWAVEGYAKWD